MYLTALHITEYEGFPIFLFRITLFLIMYMCVQESTGAWGSQTLHSLELEL